MPDPNELTPQNAPRDAALLAQYTPYQLRCLAEKYLAGIRDEKEKMGWFQLRTNEARAAYILDLLKRYDGTTNGAPPHANGVSAPSVAAPATRAPVTSAPSVQSMTPVAAPGTAAPSVAPTVNMPPSVAPTTGPAPFIPQVAPAAVAAAGAAAGEKTRRRAPSTTTAPAADLPADLGATIVNLLNRVVEGQAADKDRFDGMVKTVSSILEEAAGMKSSRIEVLEGHYTTLTKQLETLGNLVESSWKVQTWLLMMLLQSQANANNADIVDVLRMAISDGDSFQTILAQARGKA